jgi:hypothetical protein
LTKSFVLSVILVKRLWFWEIKEIPSTDTGNTSPMKIGPPPFVIRVSRVKPNELI